MILPTTRAPKGCNTCARERHCLLGRLPSDVHRLWQPHITEKSFHKGELLLQQGRIATELKIIKVGTALVLRQGEDGLQRPVGLFGSAQTLGSAALLGEPAQLSCQAIAPGRACVVPIETIERLGLVDVALLQALAAGYARSQAQLADWAHIVRIRGATGQLAAALLLLARVQGSSLVRLPSHAILADLLATTRETIARSLRSLAQQDGVLRRDRWHCEIHAPALLALSAAGRAPR
ncbi:MAG: Crp/Fnr family transcriptional regulator [Comamonas sp.]|nr:Crp/Fnr family transcriptional regulator [Comamonas sp.]